MKDPKRPTVTGLAILALALLLLPSPGRAQHSQAPPPAAYALENVTVIHPDGREEVGVNLVVRKGLIAALGAGVAIPEDAVVLEGDSLRVYPGLVDAHGRIDTELPDPRDNGEVLSWNPPRDRQGFTPHRLVADHLAATGSDGSAARKAGVVAAGIHPEGGMAPGHSATVLFRKTAEYPWNLVARPRTGLHFTFQGARGVYPSTLFAVMAFFRQSFEDAGRQGLIRSEYGEDPRGLSFPGWDPDLEALRKAAAGSLPVFFEASSVGDIRRVLDLAHEIGFRAVILGGEEAWKVADELVKRDVPVLVSVDFPTPREWNPEGEEEGTMEEDLEPAAAREKERLENAYANAGRLVSEGVSVALTSGGEGGDFREGVARAMEYGLAEADALSAVTTVPASLLGIPHIPRVETGMAANLVVADGPLFGEDTGIRYTFVEGELEEGSTGGGRDGPPPSVDITGEWEVMVNAQGMNMPFTLTVAQEGAEFSGTMSNPEMGEARVRDGFVSGNEITFVLILSAGPQSMEARAEGRVTGDEIRGSGSGEMGSFTFTATRKPGVEEGGIR
jgi:hypothetical protein